MKNMHTISRDLCIHRTGILFSVWAFFGIHTRDLWVRVRLSELVDAVNVCMYGVQRKELSIC